MPTAGTGGWKLIHGNGKEGPFPWLPQLGNLVDYLSWFLLDVHKPPIGKCHPLFPFLIGLLSSVFFSAECFEPPIYWCFAICCVFLSVTQYLFLLLLVIYLMNSFVQNTKLSYYGSFSEPGRTHPFCRLSYLWARGASKAGGEWRSLLTRFTISPARLGSKPPKANTFSICETWASRSGTLLVLTTSVLENSQVMNSWWENHF